jgi:hypothetical protein
MNGEYSDSGPALVQADERPRLQMMTALTQQRNEARSQGTCVDILRSHLNNAGCLRLRGCEYGAKIQVMRENDIPMRIWRTS